MIQELNRIANSNGGGLSTAVTGQYTSVRHAKAKASGKHTAGEGAKRVSKYLKIKVSAKELVEAYKLLYGREPEWHHAGFYKGGSGSQMGRTFFFTEEQLADLCIDWGKVEGKRQQAEEQRRIKATTEIVGCYYEWDYDWSGPRGRKRNYKVLRTYKGPQLNAPKGFIRLTPEQYAKALEMEGRAYYGWDEPRVSDFY